MEPSKSLSKQELLAAFKRSGYTFEESEFCGGATLSHCNDDGEPVYEVAAQDDSADGAFIEARVYGKFIDGQLHLEF